MVQNVFNAPEHDACAIIAYISKSGRPTHKSVKRTLEALVRMGHRSGGVDGEGDGCGIQTDIPRTLWQDWLDEAGHDIDWVLSPRFFVGHFFVLARHRDHATETQNFVREIFAHLGCTLLIDKIGETNAGALGPQGRASEPLFWQVGGLLPPGKEGTQAKSVLLDAHLAIEAKTPLHIVSLSVNDVVYKVLGDAEILDDFFPDLARPEFTSVVTLGHSRYSTNTLANFERCQPFAVLGHNGEINTIDKLRREAETMGLAITAAGSDSQDMDRALHSLLVRRDLSLMAGMEVLFPPMADEAGKLSPDLRAMYRYLRWAWGPLAQGPAAIVSRKDHEAVFAVDALGLRPLWFGEIGDHFFFSSEQGVVSVTELMGDPKPLAPGEKIALLFGDGQPTRVLPYHEIQRRVFEEIAHRFDVAGLDRVLALAPDVLPAPDTGAASPHTGGGGGVANLLAAFNWSKHDEAYIEAVATTGNEPISSLGYDGPLAALAPDRQSVSDYFKEAVAVVTNPAMDREREMEHFNTRCYLGPRPNLVAGEPLAPAALELFVPLLLDGACLGEAAAAVTAEDLAQAARANGTCRVDDLASHFGPGRVATLPLTFRLGLDLRKALDALGKAAVARVRAGAHVLVLDDTDAFDENRLPLDPHLALAVVDRALRETRGALAGGATTLRRNASLVLRSGGIRNLHDIILAVGLGADAIAPYTLFRVAVDVVDKDAEDLGATRVQALSNAVSSLQKGLEKVISTMGTHELAGYGRMFASVGLSSEVAQLLEAKNFYGRKTVGLTLERLDAEARHRYAIARSADKHKKREDIRFYPKVWKLAGQVAAGTVPYADYAAKVRAQEEATPISLRHLLDFKWSENPLDLAGVDTRIDVHDLPLGISSMSFGSQGETAFRAYANAAKHLNVVCVNGEGGEIGDMMGCYTKNRGQQIASGRFGVNIDMINSSYVLEIKIGQGAKPGEGGHLPGKKVSEKVARARHATPGVDLISPSNNHDIYSIEDLAQIIEELHTANPAAKVSVKVPVVPNIGTIALGIAKAGADIITLSGYDGGTGAARVHALKYVGLPVEIGVKEAHRALVQAGVRDEVEIWCDGGMKTGTDVMKMILLGANRCGFGTLAMVAAGCTVCHGCQLDTCHVGIATQVETVEEARAHHFKRFVPRVLDTATLALVTLLGAVGSEIRRITADLGAVRTQDLVGRSDLLFQARGEDKVTCFDLVAPVLPLIPLDTDLLHVAEAVRRLRRPLAHATKMISEVVTARLSGGDDSVVFEDSNISASDRGLGTYLSGEMSRRTTYAGLRSDKLDAGKSATLHFQHVIPGNGLGAFNFGPLDVRVEGGAQDGVGKGALGGRVVVLKGINDEGQRVDGSIGKGFGYGAQGGTFLIQGDADSRACIRLSGADVVIGGEIKEPLRDEWGCLGARANIKGFAFEYMTSGRALVLGDPGPWICAGMTGGTVYLKLNHAMGFDEAAIKRRIAKGAKVVITGVSDDDVRAIRTLLAAYGHELKTSSQHREAKKVDAYAAHAADLFVKIIPANLQVEQTVSTE